MSFVRLLNFQRCIDNAGRHLNQSNELSDQAVSIRNDKNERIVLAPSPRRTPQCRQRRMSSLQAKQAAKYVLDWMESNETAVIDKSYCMTP